MVKLLFLIIRNLPTSTRATANLSLILIVAVTTAPASISKYVSSFVLIFNKPVDKPVHKVGFAFSFISTPSTRNCFVSVG